MTTYYYYGTILHLHNNNNIIRPALDIYKYKFKKMMQRLSNCRRLRIVVSVAREVIHFEQQYIDNTYFFGWSHLAYLSYFCYALPKRVITYH